MITWPASLPLPQRDGYGYQQPELLARADFALGSRSRQLFKDGPDTFTATLELTPAQWQFLQGWHRFVLGNGAAWFSMPLLAAGTLEQREVRLTGPLSYQLLGPLDVRVSFPLETRIGTTLSAEYFAALAAFPDPETVTASLQALEDFVNG